MQHRNISDSILEMTFKLASENMERWGIAVARALAARLQIPNKNSLGGCLLQYDVRFVRAKAVVAREERNGRVDALPTPKQGGE